MYLPREARYGMPTADQILINRYYTVGYSFRIRQPKWVLEIIDNISSEVGIDERKDSFRPDARVPEIFRVQDDDYKGSGYDRGHLIASANKLNSDVGNSETFLMTNMSPQLSSLNRGLWKSLEDKIRKLHLKDSIAETYCLSGPLWGYGLEVDVLNGGIKNGQIIPIPHYFFKCILTESKSGSFKFYAFMIPNSPNLETLDKYQRTVREIEIYSGLQIWNKLVGSSIHMKKEKKYKLWF